jgi:hypothetical protein
MWTPPATGANSGLAEFEADARRRVAILDPWLRRLDELVRMVKGWADDLGWATRVISKPMEDSEIGRYMAPALQLQEGTTQVLLEPVGRSAPGGVDGVVDFYEMPAYDDIATLYHRDGRWHVRHARSADVGEARPLTRAGFRTVLAELTSHAR